NANWTSFHSTPASTSAAWTASDAISIAGFSPNRPNGCKPTPMMATSFISKLLDRSRNAGSDRREGDGHDLVPFVVDEEGNHAELDLHADTDVLGVLLGEARFNSYVVAEFDETDRERSEGLGVLAAAELGLRQELLCCPRDDGAAAREQRVGHVRLAAP